MHVYDWLGDLGVGGPSVSYPLVEVMFKNGRKDLYRNVSELDLQTATLVAFAVGTALLTGTRLPTEVRPWDYAAQTVFAVVAVVALSAWPDLSALKA